MKKIVRLRKEWKILISAIIAVFLFGGVMIYANADTSVAVTISSTSVSVASGSDVVPISVTLTGTDDNTDDNQPKVTNVKWTSSNNNIVTFLSSTGVEVDNVTGTQPTLRGKMAGQATVTATYYSKIYNPDGSIESEIEVSSASCVVTVPLSISITAYDSVAGADYPSLPNVYHIGDTISMTSNNTYIDNALITSMTNSGVVELVSSTYNSALLKVVGGGQVQVVARTVDGDGNDKLSRMILVRGEVKFLLGESNKNEQGNYIEQIPSTGEKFMVLNNEDYKLFSYEEIPSNVADPATSGVIYRSADSGICKVDKGNVLGVKTGKANILAGLATIDTTGNEAWYTKDNVTIVVPFKKLGSNVSTMNVGDQLQLETSAPATTLTWSTTDNSIIQVDPSTGLVTANSAGTATIIVERVHDSSLDPYMAYSHVTLKDRLEYTITVIDGFGISSTESTVNMGESIELQAIVTNDDLKKYPVTYKVENQPNAVGVVPTGDLIKVAQDGKKFTVTGVAPGTTKITVSQNINGVIKSASCVIYVTTPVGKISINPSTLKIDRGSSDVVQVLFDPADPTNDNVLWYTSNPAIATVEGDSHTATIKGVSGGSATISVISEDGLNIATCEVYVREPVTGVTLNETTVESSMSIGSFQLRATVLPYGEGVNRNVTWTSSDPSVCTVDENGLVTYVKPGYATIICKTEEGGYMATCNFFVSIPVESIKLDYTDEIMSVGGTLRITAEVLPLEASNRTVAWESSNTNVCVVDSTGYVEAVGTGSCTILCKSLDGNATAMCNIYVKQPVTTVVLNTTDITVRKGQVFWLNATCLPENADNKICTWTSRDEDVCKVENDGKVTAVGAGTTSIIVTNTDSGLTAFCVVTVIQPVTGITLNSDYQQLWVGAKYAIIPNIEPVDAENKKVKYLSSDPSVATVDENGVVTAVKGGSCIIEVTTEECSLTAACTIDVKEYVSSIELSETFKFMNIGATGKLSASVQTATATNKNITWSSSNYDICSVDAEGNLIANNPGTVVITATAADGSGVTGSCIVQVVNPVTSITIDPDTVRMLVGDSAKVSAIIEPANATIQTLTWISSNEAVATVDESGEIFAVGTGKCKITAISQDGNEIKGSCWVYVTPVINISSLKINSSDIYMLTGKSRQLSVRVRPASNTDSYEWYSTDTGVVVVDQNGVISTVGPGVADVVVESNSAGVSSTCTVHSLGLSAYNVTLEQYDPYWIDVIGTTDKVTWRSSNPRVCTVDQTGHIVARMAGTAVVKAIVDNKTLTCTVRVTNFR